jgi:GNAT superfamily N-acetyltransferase
VSAVAIARFRAEDQDAVRALVLDGLRERWGALDPSLNADLDDIARTYAADHVVLVAHVDGELVGTGTLLLRAGAGEIVRMSVATPRRRTGIGRALVDALLAEARGRGLTRVVLETTAAWTDAVTFYERCGFTITHEETGSFGRDVYLACDLERGEGRHAE